ncbi:MAG: protein tyrosine phosphatase family protein [Pseudomonadota bacterium]
MTRLLRWLASALLLLLCGLAWAQAAALRAPNAVEISPRLVTSGQPSVEVLATLAASGFGAVVYLAPPTVSDAVRDEGLIVARQGLVFVNIPMAFDNPTEQDFEAFAGALRGLAGRKVLVHCQINLRASTMVFLYRSIVGREDPRVAYEAVSRLWTPDGPWKRLVQLLLRKNAIDFEPF